MSLTVLAATGNLHKLAEMRQILEPHGIRLLGAADVPGGLPPVVEDGDTFLANAVKKAMEVAAALDMPTLADDSGLAVDALGGAPGVWSARYAGPAADDRRNLEKLLRNLRGVDDRQAGFVCVIALARPGHLIGTATGEIRGRICTAPAGAAGFGYDPVFVPEGYDLTFAELGEAEKNRISHRGRALEKALESGLFASLNS